MSLTDEGARTVAARAARLLADTPAATHLHRLLVLLRERAYRAGSFTLASGETSDFYIDCRRVTLTAEGHFLIGWLLNHLTRELFGSVRGVGGMALGAAPLASATAMLSYLGGRPLDALYVRKQPKDHGTRSAVEGGSALEPGAEVVVVEDVITTGGSTLRAVEALRAAGFAPRGVLALVDREQGGGRAVSAQLPLVSLYRRGDFHDAQ